MHSQQQMAQIMVRRSTTRPDPTGIQNDVDSKMDFEGAEVVVGEAVVVDVVVVVIIDVVIVTIPLVS